MDNIDYIANNISELAVLMALAEEANELSKAAMKLARAKGLLDNPTPISVEQAENDLIEEYNDLLNCIVMLQRVSGLTVSENMMLRDSKYQRWAERIESYKPKLEKKQINDAIVLLRNFCQTRHLYHNSCLDCPLEDNCGFENNPRGWREIK